MIVQAKLAIYISCSCGAEWRAEQLSVGKSTVWTCDICHKQSRISRVNAKSFDVIPTGCKETPVTVTLRSATIPSITVKLNTWKYAHSQDDSPEDYRMHQEYYYNLSTCPINWIDQIVQIEFDGDTDPHGVFQFVDVVDGHFEE